MFYRTKNGFKPVARVISGIVLSCFIWVFCGFFEIAIAAKLGSGLQPPVKPAKAVSRAERVEEKLEKAVLRLEKVIENISGDTDLKVSEKKKHAREIRDEINVLDLTIEKQFEDVNQKLKKLVASGKISDKKLARHTEFVRKYKDDLAVLLNNIDGLDASANKAELKVKSKALSGHIQKIKAKTKHTPLDPNNLPHSTAKPTNKKPRLTKEEFKNIKAENEPLLLAYNGEASDILPDSYLTAAATALPTAADLGETIEVKFTPDITAKAAELNHNPVEIYNWVKNNIEFAPTYGSIQGADYCLKSRQCNAFDTASLLIALLRTSNIAARYSIGTVEMPIDKVMNWAGGFTDPQAALEFMSQGGIPVSSMISGGQIVAAQFEHVWVEAYVDYIPSRGAKHKNGDTWIPLDASFKQYTYTEGLDVQAITGFDAQGFYNDVTQGSQYDTVTGSFSGLNTLALQQNIANFKTTLDTYLNSNMPNATGKDIVGRKDILLKNVSFLPVALPYKKVTDGIKSAQLNDDVRYRITFEIQDDANSTISSVTKSLAELAGTALSLNYSPATPEDENTIISLNEAGELIVPAYLVDVIPQVRVDRNILISGNPIGLGVSHGFKMILSTPTMGTKIIQNFMEAGSYNSIIPSISEINENIKLSEKKKLDIVLNKVNMQLPLFSDEITGAILNMAGMLYWSGLDFTYKTSSSPQKIVSLKLPSFGTFSYDLKVGSVFGVPTSVTGNGFATDIDLINLSVGTKDGVKDKIRYFMYHTGMVGSRLEASIYEKILNGTMSDMGITTAHILEYARNNFIQTFNITKNNINSSLPLLSVSYEVINDIKNAVAAGKEVLIPQHEVNIYGWQGTGYVVTNPETGDAAYMISGGSAGGDVPFNAFFDWYQRNINEGFIGWCWDNCIVSESSINAITSITVSLILNYQPIPPSGGAGGAGGQGVSYDVLVTVIQALLGVGFDGYSGATSLDKIDKSICPALYNLTLLNMIIGMVTPMKGLVLIAFPGFLQFYIGFIFILQILMAEAIVYYSESCP